MRLKIVARAEKGFFIPYDYHYRLHAAIYGMIAQSSEKYAEFLHDTGFLDENKSLKLFTFSKLFFHNNTRSHKGFNNVKELTFYFSTPIPNSFEHVVLGIFSKEKLSLSSYQNPNEFYVKHVETIAELQFKSQMKFTCLSPIAVAKKDEKYQGKHYLDYMIPIEKENYLSSLKNNLLRKYRMIHNQQFVGDNAFQFSFDPEYIVKRQGKIRKNIKFKNSRIIAMEAPFTIIADPELIKIGYECGFGSENSAGFGMAEVTKLS